MSSLLMNTHNQNELKEFQCLCGETKENQTKEKNICPVRHNVHTEERISS